VMQSLALPKPKEDDELFKGGDLTDEEQLIRALSELDELIAGIAHNPVFKEVGADNAQLSAKAGGDLAKIIALSDRIGKCSKELSKAKQQ
jgi:hypothetical protein